MNWLKQLMNKAEKSPTRAVNKLPSLTATVKRPRRQTINKDNYNYKSDIISRQTSLTDYHSWAKSESERKRKLLKKEQDRKYEMA